VVGVLAYNKWQEHRHRKVAEQVLQAGQDDVLLVEVRAPSRPKPQSWLAVLRQCPSGMNHSYVRIRAFGRNAA
jgi:hypothetical protein